MPLSTAAKAALCICPPALMVGTATTVPSVKRAIHHLTGDRHASKPSGRAAARGPVRTQAATERQEDCAPGPGAGVPELPLVTYASPIPDEPGGGGISGPGGGAPVIGAVGLGSPGGGNPTTPVVPEVPGPGPVPEPSVWLMMIVGVGASGAMLRRRRRAVPDQRGGRTMKKVAAGGALWSGSAAVEAGDLMATVAAKSAVASAATKAMLCVCPAAIVAGSVMTVPPIRHAVHTATAMPEAAPVVATSTIRSLQPCQETMTVPIAATEPVGSTAFIAKAPAASPVSAPVVVAMGG